MNQGVGCEGERRYLEGRQDLSESFRSQATGACHPLLSVDPGQQKKGHSRRTPSFRTVGQTLLQVAQCTMFVTRGQVHWERLYSKMGKPNITTHYCIFLGHHFMFIFMAVDKLFFFINYNYSTSYRNACYRFILFFGS